MADEQADEQVAVKEGSRWRYFKPSSEEVAEWFSSVPLDEGMKHADYVAGVVLIPASEKIKRTRADRRGTEDIWEQTFTPYVRVDTRVAYFHKLAQEMSLIAVIEPVPMPRTASAAYFNEHMPDGFWWHIMGEQANAQRFLCATWRVALYEREPWLQCGVEERIGEGADAEVRSALSELRPVREGRGTKQVTGSPDINALAKAETGAIGRALGVAGILVVGTGIATAEDMEALRETPVAAPVALPEAGEAQESEEALNERLMTLQAALRRHPDSWTEFSAWWGERSKTSGWRTVGDAPLEARRGVASKMEAMIAEAGPPPPDESPAEATDGAPD